MKHHRRPEITSFTSEHPHWTSLLNFLATLSPPHNLLHRPRMPSTSSAPLRILHIHIPHLIPYITSLALQDRLLSHHWTYRTHLRTPTNPPPNPPLPYLLTFSTTPTYTVGRRHLQTHPLSTSQISFLTANNAATFHPSPRGGLLTYHAPGQVTAYPIIDLRRFGLSPKCFVRSLENAVIKTCESFLPPTARIGRTSDPGVWMLDPSTTEDSALDATPTPAQTPNACDLLPAPQSGTSTRKICAVGVQITRGVSSHGVGLNVHDAPIPVDLRSRYNFDDIPPPPSTHHNNQSSSSPPLSNTEEEEQGYLSYGFNRITACGLEGKTTTWLSQEGADTRNISETVVADRLAVAFVESLNAMRGPGREIVEGVTTVTLKEAQGREEAALEEMLQRAGWAS